MKHVLQSTFLLAALAASPAALASDYGCDGDCYRKVHLPPVYESVPELYVARQGHTVSRYVPPSYGTVTEPLVTRPARTVARVTPASFSVVTEKVQVTPARREWQVSYDAAGREIGCWVDVPATYALRKRRVMVRPEQVTYVTVPEQVALVPRTVMTHPARVVKGRVPTVYETRYRDVQVAPAREAWEPLSEAPAAIHAPGRPTYGLSYVSTSVTIR